MSQLDFIRTPKVDNVKLVDHALNKKAAVGTLHITTTHIIFVDPRGAQETWILYNHIAEAEKLPITAVGSSIRIKTKTFRNVTFVITRERECTDVFATIIRLANPTSFEDLYAFHYKPKENEKSTGWNSYDAVAEFERMEVPSHLWVQTKLNREYKLCETYSNVLYVPVSVSDEVIIGSAQFRSKNRLPALSYYYKQNQTAICRCAQPMAGLNNRCSEDEQMLQGLIQSTPNSTKMYIVDTRPKINAMANRAAGKGYENVANYENVDFHFIGIENIHVMRQSLQKMIEVFDTKHLNMSSYLGGLEDSGWLKHIKAVMDTSLFVARAVSEEKRTVLVHCSDGWDRTAQTCSLAEMVLDPYYRTIYGFQVLVEKEWLAFGYKFTHRCGFLSGDPKEMSPIFTQFLESVWHLMNLYPTAFQFNERFLLEVHDHLYSCQFGTFLGNCEKDRISLQLSTKTYSLWGYMWQNLPDFINPFYKDGDHGVLKPSTSQQQFKFWRSLYNRYSYDVHPRVLVADYVCSLNDHNDSLKDHIRYLEKRIEAINNTRVNSRLQLDNTKSEDTIQTMLHEAINDVDNEKRVENLCKRSLNEDVVDSTRRNNHAVSDVKNVVTVDESESLDSKDSSDSSKYPATEASNNVTGSMLLNERYILNNSKNLLSPNKLSKTESIPDLTKDIPSFAVDWDSFREVSQCSCGKPIDFLSRKYNCWNCGKVFCARCVDLSSQLPGHNSGDSVPVCKSCYKRLRR